MDEQLNEQGSGVEEVQAAAGQSQEVEGTVGSPDAGQQSEQPEAAGQEQAFAKRLSQERAKLQREYDERMSSYRDPATERMMKLYKYDDYDAFVRDLEAAEQEAQVQERANELGIEPDVIRQHLMPLDAKTQAMEQELNTLKEQELARQFEARVSELEAKYPDFGPNKDAIYKFSFENRIELEHAYKLLTYDQKLESVASDAQRQAIQNIQKNAHTSPGPLGSDAPGSAGSYIEMTPAERKAFRERVKNGG